MSDDLITWLRAQLDEDEAIALATIDATHRAEPPRWVYADDRSIRDTSRDAILRVKHTWNQEAAHIIRHDPARVLREVAAKRYVLDNHTPAIGWTGMHEGRVCVVCSDNGQDGDRAGDEYPCAELRHLAAVYADRPGWKEEWRP